MSQSPQYHNEHWQAMWHPYATRRTSPPAHAYSTKFPGAYSEKLESKQEWWTEEGGQVNKWKATWMCDEMTSSSPSRVVDTRCDMTWPVRVAYARDSELQCWSPLHVPQMWFGSQFINAWPASLGALHNVYESLRIQDAQTMVVYRWECAGNMQTADYRMSLNFVPLISATDTKKLSFERLVIVFYKDDILA